VKHGGKRAGAGYVGPGDIAWARVREAAEVGSTEEDIVAALGISAATLADPDTLARFRAVVTLGNARARLELQAAIAKRGTRTVRGAGSVNALALRARNLLDWDKGLIAQEVAPDTSAAHSRLRQTLERLAAKYSVEFGRSVSAAEVLITIALGVEVGADPPAAYAEQLGAAPPPKTVH
jgi:hypothetical protein